LARPELIYRRERDNLGSTLVLAAIYNFGCLFFAPYLGVSGTVIAIFLVTGGWVYLRWLAGFYVVLYEPETKELILEWRGLLFGLGRKVFQASRFGSVVSSYSWGKGSMNVVHLLEHSGEPGLQVAGFPLNYQYKSFWDLRPKIVESEGARELRVRLVALVGVKDEGFVGMRASPKRTE